MGELAFNAVTKVYGDEITAVDEFDLTIEDGEFIALVGPSGSGKSTLLRMVAGLEEITGGEIVIGDTTVNRLPPRRRDIAMVFQNYALYPHLDVRENMAFGLKRSTDLPRDRMDERVEDAAELMGIESLLDQKPKQLSGGQKQRVATGRAIVREPEVFLFDEPLSNLDAKLRKHMRIELQRLQKTLDTTTIYVTHDQEEAMTMSDRIAILNFGELQQIGAPREVYNQPANKFVAQFIGSPSMNIFETEYVDDGEHGSLVGDIDIELNGEQASALRESGKPSGEYAVGIRPEDIEVQTTSSLDAIEAYVDIVEPLGSNDLLYFNFDEPLEQADDLGRSSSDAEGDTEEFKVFIEPGSVPEETSSVYLTVDPSQVHIFDPETGTNVGFTAPEAAQESEAVAPTQ